ncbi:transposase [Streptomyces bohaiensis]|uniref:Transposase n=1 Tax=Streptomyces bohaiensis TaxID=1431344 RepID=A0ABX1C3M4_9ACTN|nr:transposase [Streptomyces bohaiensis]
MASRPDPARDGRQRQGLHPVHRRDGGDPGTSDRSGAPTSPTRSRPGDKSYSSKAIRTWLRRKGIAHRIPEQADQVRNPARRGRRGGRPSVFDRETVDRRFERLKRWRGIATRYDKTAEPCEAAGALASLLMGA